MSDARERHLSGQRQLVTIHVHPDFDFPTQAEAEWFAQEATRAIMLLFGKRKVIVDSEVRPRMRTV